jgi:Fe2+ or Zn2+ uptake regulation protein
VSAKSSGPAPLRLAKNYRFIDEIVREHGRGQHLSTADVYALAHERRPGIGFTTVYRALRRLRELGLISEINVHGADGAHYEPAGAPHAHFRCSTCGKVEDVAYTLPPAVVERLASEHSADVTDVSLTLHGRCATCKDRAV